MELKGFSEFINEMSTVFRNDDVLCTVNPGFGRIGDSYFKLYDRYDHLWTNMNGCILNFLTYIINIYITNWLKNFKWN